MESLDSTTIETTTPPPQPERRVGLSDWQFRKPDVLACVALLLLGSLLWLPGLGTRGLWTSGEARAVQHARRMVQTGDWVPMTLQKREPVLMVDPNSGTPGSFLVGWDEWPTKLSYGDGAVLALEEEWRDSVHLYVERNDLGAQVRYGHPPQIHKPVFFYWLVAAGYWLGLPMDGPWTNAVIRGFSTVPAILLLPVVYLMGCLFYDRLAGLIGSVVLATCVEYFWIARVAKMDMTLTFLFGVAFLLWYLNHRGIRPRLCSLAIFVILGCAALMKSLAYFFLPGLIVLVYLLVEQIGERGFREGLRQWPGQILQAARRMHFVVGVLIVLAIWLPWHVLIHIETDGQFTREMFLRHNLARAGLIEYGKEFGTTTNPAFYLGRLFVDLLPWWIMLPGAIVHVCRPRCRPFWRQGAYLLVCSTIWFLFFSALHYRKEEYILPMYPAVVLLIGKLLADWVRSPAGGHISWRVFADATRVGLAWMVGKQTTTADPNEAVEGDLRLTIAVRIASIVMAVAVGLAGAFVLLIMSEGVRRFLFTFPDASDPWIGTNEHDRTAFETAGMFLRQHIHVVVVFGGGVVAAMIAAAVMVFRKRPGVAIALWTVTMAVALSAVVHVFQDRVLDPYRSQRALAERIEEVIAETGPETRMILFGAEEHELTMLMPEQFDAIPRFRFGMLRGRVAALSDHPVLILLPRADYANKSIFGRFSWGDLYGAFEEVPTNMPRYDRGHNDALVILRVKPGAYTGTQPVTQSARTHVGGPGEPHVGEPQRAVAL